MKQKVRVIGIVRRQDEVLLLRKDTGRQEVGAIWELLRGKIRYGEQPEESMARAVFEGLGATIENAKLRDVVTVASESNQETFYNLFIIYDVFLKEGERLAAGGKYTAYKFVKYTDPQAMASLVIENEARTIMDIELGRTARAIFDGVTGNLVGGNLNTATVYVDGGSRGNPGPSGIGYYIVGRDGTPIKSGGEFIGFATSRVAEYYALKKGCEQAIELGIKSVRFVSDSLMMVNQMNGIYKIKNKDIMPIYDDIQRLLKNFDTVAFMHVKRTSNTEADSQVNLAINRHFDLTK